MKLLSIKWELTRYIVVGVVSNMMLYLTFLWLTKSGLEHKIAMSFIYVVGLLLTFVFNKAWTFSHSGHLRLTFFRYVLLYAMGYVINLSVMLVMVDLLGYSHEWVQGMMILVVALMLFVMQKAWVFSCHSFEEV